MTRVEELEEHLEVLTEFERDYRRYIEAQEVDYHGDEPDLTPDHRTALRRDLLRRVDPAERAMRTVDKMIHVEPPRFYGGPVLTSLSDQTFAHETPRYGGTEGREFDLPHGLLDTMVAALGALENQLKQAQRDARELDNVRDQMDQIDEHFEGRLERPDITPRQKASKANAEDTHWHHNPWVVAIGSTVIAGAILALIFGTS